MITYPVMSATTGDAYTQNKLLSVAEKALLKTAKEEILSSCGMQFVTSGPLSQLVLLRERVNCQSPTEAQYYSVEN